MGDTITVECIQLEDILASLNRLSGTPEKPNDLTADLAWNIAKNATLIEREVKAFKRAKAEVAKSCKVIPGINYGAEKSDDLQTYIDRIQELNEKTVTISGILLLKRSDLQKKGNVIMTQWLTALMPMLLES